MERLPWYTTKWKKKKQEQNIYKQINAYIFPETTHEKMLTVVTSGSDTGVDEGDLFSLLYTSPYVRTF